ncbi:MAG: hypothetical protein P0Y55_18155 [Candidatus Cohnella colombiensis]|uniref:ABC transporter permease n=1 Tax=Candidatus Cohnella colombiensis TaxID=3121368 RepID=A0AA95EWZ1_9BACL|nr:MAG: hypothetical protein P0Y55_18155 [Cohnella sp.]
MRVFWKAVQMNFRVFFAYKMGFLLSIIIFPMVMAINIYLFTSIYSYNGSTEIKGYDLTQMIWYYGVTVFVWIFIYNMVDRRMSGYILSGELAPLLLRPMPLFQYELANALALRLAGILFEFFPVMALYSIIYPPTFLTFASFGKFLVLIMLAFILLFLLNYIVGMSAALTQSNVGTARVVNALLVLLGGTMIPLEFFPDWLRRICGVLPFQYIFYEPVQFFIRHGDTSIDAWLQVIVMQFIWIVVLYTIVRSIWAFLLRNIVVAGG